jgi:hypothetical protein
MNMAWNNRLMAYPDSNQKYIRRIPEIINIAQMSIEKLPIERVERIRYS